MVWLLSLRKLAVVRRDADLPGLVIDVEIDAVTRFESEQLEVRIDDAHPGMYGQPLLGRSGVLRRIIASTVFGLRGLRLFGRDLLLASAMINSCGELVMVSGSYGLPPMRPALFCCREFPSLPFATPCWARRFSDHRCKGDSVQQPMIEKQSFETSLAALAS
ncbi:hypothetical protein [Burkholderia ubonensis]|uniref:hypothetical protein n=1 Tax=Burkholderia ubonensis TaxID=101571 RepID=UPI00075385C9|nr:hypothetical protein [Burkholderia ubonensis]